MCRIYDAEPCEFTSQRIVKARKPHKCTECVRAIEPGEHYENTAYRFEGGFFVNKTCQHCLVARQWLLHECHGFVWSEVEEDLREHWHDEGIRTMELGRLIIGMARRWRKRNGQLMAVPCLQNEVVRN
jgi:hypothetical protein